MEIGNCELRIMKNIGIYSGSFDPVHDGHIEFAKKAIDSCPLDKVYFLVEPRPRDKQGVKAFSHRSEMVRLSVKNEPKMGLLLVDQQRFTPTSTLPILAKRFEGAELYMLMGDDVLGHFAGVRWPDVEKLMNGVTFAVGLRKLTQKEAKSRINTINETTGLKMNCRIFGVRAGEISSRKIKKDFKDGNEPKGLNREVRNYIAKNHLYVSHIVD